MSQSNDNTNMVLCRNSACFNRLGPVATNLWQKLMIRFVAVAANSRQLKYIHYHTLLYKAPFADIENKPQTRSTGLWLSCKLQF